MTDKKYERLLQPILDQARKDGDVACFVYFSKADALWSGMTEGVGTEEARIVIRQVAATFLNKGDV